MNPPDMPPWGCPWHGLVNDGVLKIDAGGGLQMPWPELRGAPPYAGRSTLVQVPGLPEIVRTSEQQQEDQKEGRQWWNKALLAGDPPQLHGKQLQGDWLYLDPKNNPWLVEFPRNMAATVGRELTITLKRFGVLSGKPKERQVKVIVPPTGQGAPAFSQIPENELRLRVWHVHPQGRAAIIAITWQPSDLRMPEVRGYRGWPIYERPLGYLELTIAGGADDFLAGLQLIRSRQDVAGTFDERFFDMPAQRMRLQQSVRRENDTSDTSACTGSYDIVREWTWTPDPQGNRGIYAQAFDLTSKQTDLILSLFYKPDGTIGELTLDITGRSAYEPPVVSFSAQKGVTRYEYRLEGGVCQAFTNVISEANYTLSASYSASFSLIFAMKVDGQLVSTFTASEESQTSETETLKPAGIGEDPTFRTFDLVLTKNPGRTATQSLSGRGPIGSVGGDIGKGRGGGLSARRINVVLLLPWTWTHLVSEDDVNGEDGRLGPFMYSTHMAGMLRYYTLDDFAYRYEHSPTVATPGGGLDIEPLAEVGLEPSVGAWCPARNIATYSKTKAAYI